MTNNSPVIRSTEMNLSDSGLIFPSLFAQLPEISLRLPPAPSPQVFHSTSVRKISSFLSVLFPGVFLLCYTHRVLKRLLFREKQNYILFYCLSHLFPLRSVFLLLVCSSSLISVILVHHIYDWRIGKAHWKFCIRGVSLSTSRHCFRMHIQRVAPHMPEGQSCPGFAQTSS